MKKRIFCLFLAIVILVGACAALSACGGGGDKDCKEHVNNDADGKCDICGKKMKHDHYDDDADGKCDFCSKSMDEVEEEIEYPWADEDPIPLLFQMTHNTDGKQNPSGCERYLAGEDTSAAEPIDDMIADRNDEAADLVNVDLSYDYYLDVSEYDWGSCIEIILREVNSNSTKGTSDMYCNFTYDLVGASLKSAFANLKLTDENLVPDGNYFEFNKEGYDEAVDNKGYMYEFMESTTLNPDKMYILASDYFTDLIRSFFVVPVNIRLLESLTDSTLSNNIDDLYQEVYDYKWTYNRVAAYSAAIYSPTGQTIAGEDIEDVLGFAIGWGGQTSSGIVYSTSISIIDHDYENRQDNGAYVCDYPSECPELYKLYDNLKTLIDATGVAVIGRYTGSGTVASDADKLHDEIISRYGTDCRLAVRNRFCDNKILFGNVIIAGALEDKDSYQKLMGEGEKGFGVLPVPLYKEYSEYTESELGVGGVPYFTAIHNNARPGAIARSTKNYSACTAFLNYQSTHSSDILQQYYTQNLQVTLSGSDGAGASGTVEMLDYIRLNVRSAFDKTFEDAIGVFAAETGERWHHILSVNNYICDLRPSYQSLINKKKGELQTLCEQYDNLP